MKALLPFVHALERGFGVLLIYAAVVNAIAPERAIETLLSHTSSDLSVLCSMGGIVMAECVVGVMLLTSKGRGSLASMLGLCASISLVAIYGVLGSAVDTGAWPEDGSSWGGLRMCCALVGGAACAANLVVGGWARRTARPRLRHLATSMAWGFSTAVVAGAVAVQMASLALAG